ncbi:ABC transporter permease subunit [Staphylococcus pseudintermedius]|nr:ABC transporter permease subunit [Staphylococcus pseudintermedius]
MLGSSIDSAQLLEALYQTLYMVTISLIFGALIGVPLGIVLVATRQNGIWPNAWIHHILNPVINILRSVPLTVYVAPYIARLVENSLLEVDEGIIEAAHAMGATPIQIIRYFLLPEALGSLILSLTTAIIGLIGATAMAGAVGGGGIGDMALVYGYQRFDTLVIIITVVVLVIIVQCIQSIGNALAKKVRRH